MKNFIILIVYYIRNIRANPLAGIKKDSSYCNKSKVIQYIDDIIK